jgi:hypothetical protein
MSAIKKYIYMIKLIDTKHHPKNKKK